MKRLILVALVASVFTVAGPAHADCAGAGVSDIFRAQFGYHRLTLRTIGSPLTIGQPPASAAVVCDDASTSTPREALFTLVDTTTNATLCHRWIAYNGGYDPFGFGLVLGAGPHIPTDQICGVDGTWDPVGYAASVALGGGDPARVRFPDVETDEFGTLSGLAAGAIATATYWYEIDGQRVTLEGSDATHASYSRGVGSVTS